MIYLGVGELEEIQMKEIYRTTEAWNISCKNKKKRERSSTVDSHIKLVI